MVASSSRLLLRRHMKRRLQILCQISVIFLVIGASRWKKNSLNDYSTVNNLYSLPLRADARPNLYRKPWTVSQNILFQDRGYQCRWATYKCQYVPSSNSSLSVCLHPQGDIISDSVANRGLWNDCLAVSRQWDVASNDTNSNVHIEIGANIGSCIWELLQSDQEAQVFAFEPHPRNLFALTSTLKANPEYGKRVTLFPVALGAELGTVELALEAMPNMEGRINYGGSFVFGSLAGDAAPVGTGTVVEHRVRRELVPVERLDQVLNRFSTLQHVRLAKLDAQGFECNILDGMLPRMLPYRIVTELEPRSLQRAGCSWQGMLQRLTEYYKVYRYRQSGKLDPLPRTDLNMELNAVAILRDDGRGSINNKSTS